jgi:hypothetical protein
VVSHNGFLLPKAFFPHTFSLSLDLNSPGRFLAANEVKALLAHIIVTYDIKFEEGKGVPREYRLPSFRAPRNANILFRKRQR